MAIHGFSSAVFVLCLSGGNIFEDLFNGFVCQKFLFSSHMFAQPLGLQLNLGVSYGDVKALHA